jgi:hypothetical protein
MSSGRAGTATVYSNGGCGYGFLSAARYARYNLTRLCLAKPHTAGIGTHNPRVMIVLQLNRAFRLSSSPVFRNRKKVDIEFHTRIQPRKLWTNLSYL